MLHKRGSSNRLPDESSCADHRPKRHPAAPSEVWHYGGQKVALTLPACNPSEDFEDGLTVGVEVVALMFIAFVIRQAVGLFRLAGGTREGEDE